MKTQLIVQSQHTYQLKPAVTKTNAEQAPAPQNTQQTSYVKTSNEGAALAQKLQDDFNSTIYDQPNFNNNKAISAYMSINNQQRRNEIESLIGVNIYA
ncbi:hypothetical protein PSECIP111951_00294 [Pseudoalteromonas holothuriae]|uniref:Uncharacterized protein n=1 Tax=Pseudoalteromonas holothuriae TaxID=2963714 RepID=A0A9W4R0G6_9GAMM|nr:MULTISPECIES: hypothetical protein [unclassified Pseudoalteromonas]CAH9050932.1 hypothetical protein PSECIP111951_00294 [Pseudoalteromonas sp. CIP111951]CAH9061595.1 hypothetical protein PSECIP111854_02842 [Pseudoalteromonas sp. CIP111854]